LENEVQGHRENLGDNEFCPTRQVPEMNSKKEKDVPLGDNNP
jgi:hypothetical protein